MRLADETIGRCHVTEDHTTATGTKKCEGRITEERSTARPSAPRQKGVGPAPFSCSSQGFPAAVRTSATEIARPSPYPLPIVSAQKSVPVILSILNHAPSQSTTYNPAHTTLHTRTIRFHQSQQNNLCEPFLKGHCCTYSLPKMDSAYGVAHEWNCSAADESPPKNRMKLSAWHPSSDSPSSVAMAGSKATK